MLYDRRWEQKTRADPFLLANLVTWLEQQPAEKTYCYSYTGGCLLYQYFTAHGFDRVLMEAHRFYYGHGQKVMKIDLPDQFDAIAMAAPHTFGGALERARATLSKGVRADD